MNIKGNLKYIGTLSLIFLIIYMFLAAIPMGPDLFFEPVWTQDISGPVPAVPSDFTKKGIEAFILGDKFGYFTPEGTILSSKSIENRVSATPSAWTVYPPNTFNTPVFFPDGSPKMTVQGSGFVFLDDTRTYLFLPGGDGVSRISDTGTVVWKREHTAPISAFNSSDAGTVIGYADGQLSCIANDGTEQFSFYPGGSDNQVILGSAISRDGTLVACVSGIDRQRFLLIRITGKQYKIIYHAYLEGNLRRQAFVNFENSGSFAFFETAGGLGIIDCRTLKKKIIPFEGQIISVGKNAGDALFVVLSKNGKKFTLSAIERPDHLVATSVFTAENAFIIQRENAIYLGADNRISRIDIRGLK